MSARLREVYKATQELPALSDFTIPAFPTKVYLSLMSDVLDRLGPKHDFEASKGRELTSGEKSIMEARMQAAATMTELLWDLVAAHTDYLTYYPNSLRRRTNI